MLFETQQPELIDRREAVRRVAALLGAVTLTGGPRLMVALEKAGSATAPAAEFTGEDIAFLDEVAETILPATKTPGAKAAKTGAFIARMVTDSYWPAEQKVFRDGMREIDAATRKASRVSFMQATPVQRLAVLTQFDHEQKRVMDARDAAERRQKGLAPAPMKESTREDLDMAQEQGEGAAVAGVSAAGDVAKKPAHFFRMMKELALLGYFTSEIGCTVAQRFVETPGRFDPCLAYTAGDPAWAEHA